MLFLRSPEPRRFLWLAEGGLKEHPVIDLALQPLDRE